MCLHLQMCMLGVVSTSDHVSKYCKDMGCIACICVEGWWMWRIEKWRSVARAKVKAWLVLEMSKVALQFDICGVARKLDAMLEDECMEIYNEKT